MNLYRAFATVGGLTMASRVLGFARDILMAAALGTGPVADAFFVAFRFPNLFRRLFGEGAFNAAFVPLFAKRLEGDGEAAAARFASDAMAASRWSSSYCRPHSWWRCPGQWSCWLRDLSRTRRNTTSLST
jgi:peptidoglycan biosynthesis protein MviN/MurJ (putative lipid II flippase)